MAPTECSIHPSHRDYQQSTDDLQDLLPAPPIDRVRLLEQCLGNVDFALSLLDEFDKTSPARLDGFDAALAQHDHDAVVCQAHGLKGVAGILAFNHLTGICSNLESTTSHADWNQMHDLIQKLRREVQRILEDIPNFGLKVKSQPDEQA